MHRLKTAQQTMRRRRRPIAIPVLVQVLAMEPGLPPRRGAGTDPGADHDADPDAEERGDSGADEDAYDEHGQARRCFSGQQTRGCRCGGAAEELAKRRDPCFVSSDSQTVDCTAGLRQVFGVWCGLWARGGCIYMGACGFGAGGFDETRAYYLGHLRHSRPAPPVCIEGVELVGLGGERLSFLIRPHVRSPSSSRPQSHASQHSQEDSYQHCRCQF